MEGNWNEKNCKNINIGINSYMLVIIANISNWASNSSSGKWNKDKFPDAEPFIDENSRTQVPIRFVGEALGANVSWDGNTKKVTITLNGKK